MTEGSRAVLEFLQKHCGHEYTKYDIVEKTGIPMQVVSSSMTQFVKKGFCTQREEIIPSPYLGEKEKTVKIFSLTEMGADFDPDAQEKQLAQIRLEQKAARKLERLRQREEMAKQNFVN